VRINSWAVLLAFVVPLNMTGIALADTGSTISGQVLDRSGGLPVSNATVELEHNHKVVGTVKTAADGSFTFPGAIAGVYDVVILANGFQTRRSTDIYLTAQAGAQVRIAVDRTSQGSVKTIGGVQTGGQNSLQTTVTINEHVDPSRLQSEGYARTSNLLTTLPFVNYSSVNSSVGGGSQIGIRGFGPTETTTLLDGHPIGPLGSYGNGANNGLNFSATPMWGLSGIDVTLGSGATGMYGVPTIAGAINFQTVDPTRTPHSTFMQGIGNYGTQTTGLQATGMLGKLGYALAYGVQGTSGLLNGTITQTGDLSSPQTCSLSASNGPSIRTADVNACTYNVSSAFLQRNVLAKFTYDIDPKTHVLFSTYNLTEYNDSTGNGDNDYNTYNYVLYNAQQALAKPGTTTTNTLPSGAKVSCTNSFAVLDNSTPGYQCMSAQQYASAFSGPAGAGVDRYHSTQLQDYHARVTRQLSSNNSLVLDGFVDNYVANTGNSPLRWIQNTYTTRGFLVSDDVTMGKNDASFGVYLQHQSQGGTGVLTNYAPQSSLPALSLTNTNYFASDSYTLSKQISLFGDASIFTSQNTHYTSFNPRFSVVYRPTPADVMRVSAGRSSSEPSPQLLYGPFVQSGLNGFQPTCGAPLNSIGTGSSPFLKPESANDVEVGYGHKFSSAVQVQADAYSATEFSPLVNGVFPLSVLPGQTLTPAELAGYLGKLQGQCPSDTVNNLGVLTTFNAGSARYQGFALSSSVGVVRHLKLEGTYDVQKASYYGIPASILQTNPSLINGAQFPTTPMHQASASLVYTNPLGFDARFDGYYVGPGNALNGPRYMYANASISRKVGPLTANLGVNNIFNSYAANYGYVGSGLFVPENVYGTGMNSLNTGSELFGLPYRQILMTFAYRT
jgi:outer membrane receptor protein involved in Fe transport